MKKLIMIFVLTILMTGCATQTFTMNGGGAETPDMQSMQTFFVSGLGQQKQINAVEVCGGVDKVAKVETHLRFLDGLLDALTYGLYTPRTAKVYCVK